MREQNIEVEIRGPLTHEEYNSLQAFLTKEGEFKEKKERVLIDYSSEMEDRRRDIRIRETNGVPEIILKLGSWGNNEAREEISIKTEPNKFEALVRVFGELGFVKGVLCIRNMTVFNYKEIEFSLIEVPDHSYFFEAEILATADSAQDSESKIKKICNELGLKIFLKEDFFGYVSKLNKEANKNFDYKEFKGGYFTNREYL